MNIRRRCAAPPASVHNGQLDRVRGHAALANFSKLLSKEVGQYGIHVNTISPGPVSTGLWLGDYGVAVTIACANGVEPEAVAKHATSDSVTGRFTRPQEVADLVLLLASDRAGSEWRAAHSAR
jgi:NAD(P)-dependent dehydrogenase (short-subunit alcohol dehydrogenase family)